MVAVLGCSEERELPSECTDCRGVHPAGILDRTSDDFHGKELARRNWDFAVCATCHGERFDGGKAKVACTTCHTDGPTTCVTCHGAGPTSGSHVEHRRAGLACAECHAVPDRWDAPGHIVDDSPPAEITLGARANATPVAGDRKGPAAYTGGTCENVYCHGDALHAGGGIATRPVWATPGSTGTCVRCHAAPPPSHAQNQCATCHPASAPHIDGVTQVGTTSGCSGCHGDAQSPAPFTGAHRKHVFAPSGLRGPIACETCHVVPATLFAPGHIDTPPPAEATCNPQCHGTSQPAWTQTEVVACGTCHGIPPATASHATATTIASCATCHPSSVTPTGAIIITNGTSTHLDGVVDAP